jgi:tyrosyl-tRNA synthetase
MIGDPSDKKATRIKLTKEQVENNLKNYQDQVGRILDLNQTQFVLNGEWLEPLKFSDVIELASEFTVQQMMERDMFQERVKAGSPIYLHEFLYPLMQGYDSVALGVDLEVGGNDQLFNMLAGRTMLKRRGREKFVMTMKLLTDPTGKKMGKSEGNMITLSDEPGEMYGKVMSWPDSLIVPGFEICTRLPLGGVSDRAESQPLETKKALAFEIVRMYHGQEAAIQAETDFRNTFSAGGVPEDILTVKSLEGESLVEILLRTELVASKAEFRRLLVAGAITTEKGEPISDPLAPAASNTYRVGKKRFLKIN